MILTNEEFLLYAVDKIDKDIQLISLPISLIKNKKDDIYYDDIIFVVKTYFIDEIHSNDTKEKIFDKIIEKIKNEVESNIVGFLEMRIIENKVYVRFSDIVKKD